MNKKLDPDIGLLTQPVSQQCPPVAVYYYLTEGETIQEGDECEISNNWNDPPRWVQAGLTVGEKAPDPCYISHRKYRRLILEK